MKTRLENLNYCLQHINEVEYDFDLDSISNNSYYLVMLDLEDNRLFLTECVSCSDGIEYDSYSYLAVSAFHPFYDDEGEYTIDWDFDYADILLEAIELYEDEFKDRYQRAFVSEFCFN